MNIFDNIKINDKVYSIIDGWGVVKSIDKQRNNIPIEVSFRSSGLRNLRYFEFDGRNSNLDKYPTLYWSEKEIKDKEIVIKEIKKGDIFEWNKDDNKIKRMLFINVNFIVDIDDGSNFAMGSVLDKDIGKVSTSDFFK